MSNLKSAALAACITLGLASLAQAADLRLAAAGSNDQVVTRLATADLSKLSATLDRVPVRTSWALDPAEALADRPVPFVQQSREYWLNADEAQLRKGVPLPTTAAAALIRISPHSNNSTALSIDDVQFRNNGQQFEGRAATQSVAETAALRAAGMDVAEGTVVAKLAPAVGKGRIELAAPAAKGNYLIHVFEPTSSQVLRLGATRDTVLGGSTVQIVANLDGARAASAKGILTAPDGHTQSFDLSPQRDGSWQADVTPDAAHANGPGLWEVHAFASGSADGVAVLRDAKTAIAVAVPTARLSGTVTPERTRGGGLSLSVGVEVASASRYQLAGVLYGTAADGSRKPAAYAQSAAWIEAGADRLVLEFDAQALNGAGLKAPYELRDLRLGNQADLSTIERRERAVAEIR